MAISLSLAKADIVAKAKTMDGIATAPVNPPESINQYPFVVTYAVRSTESLIFHSQGVAFFFHLLHCEIHLSRNM